MRSNLPIEGACLCGKLRYEIAEPLAYADHCHCSMCRRQHGAAFATYAELNPDAFRWTAGEERLKVYEAEAGGGWGFCIDCGSSLVGTENGKIMSVTMGSIRGDPGIRPSSHIFTGYKASWHDISDDLQQYEKWPPNQSF